MFHEGDLQGGILSAVQQSKAVICLVYDDDDEHSQAWENSIVKDAQVAGTIQTQAIALRIAAASQEACFLSSFCPIDVIPTVVIIQNGATKGVIQYSASTQHDLGTRILALLDPSQVASHTGVANATNTVASTIGSASSRGDEPDHTANAQSSNSDDVGPPFPTATPSNEASQLDGQRSLNGHNREAEKASRRDSGSKASSGTTVPATSSGKVASPGTQPTPRQNWKRVQGERERQQREERERIKTQIKHDHAERRQLDELRRQHTSNPTSADLSKIAETSVTGNRPSSANVRIQVRTFDGSTLRSTFPKIATISGEVRGWIDSSSPEAAPYNLKIILTPQANRTIETAEEGRSLDELDIVGSCTLVMVPVRGFVESYSPAGSGLFGSTVSRGYSLFSGSVDALFGGVRSLLGVGQVTSETPAPSGRERPASPTPPQQSRVRTLADQRIEEAKKDQQFYNGNQLTFEPRKDDESNKE